MLDGKQHGGQLFAMAIRDEEEIVYHEGEQAGECEFVYSSFFG